MTWYSQDPFPWSERDPLGLPREFGEEWDALASGSGVGLARDEARFVVTEDGSVIADERGAEDAVEPLAEALLSQLEPPFCALAARVAGDVWTAAANRAEIIELPDAEGERIEVNSVGGVTTTSVDGSEIWGGIPVLDELVEAEEGDAALVAHRFRDHIWIVEVFPL